jgi:hypothetical protein
VGVGFRRDRNLSGYSMAVPKETISVWFIGTDKIQLKIPIVVGRQVR